MSFTPTEEQANALLMYRTAADVVVEAAAGSGKTSLLQLLASYAPQRRGYYLAFNKTAQLEAQQKFMGTAVQPLTLHALALRSSPQFFRDKLHAARRFVNWGMYAKIAGITEDYCSDDCTLSRQALTHAAKRTVDAFMQSADPEPALTHVRLPRGVTGDEVALAEARALVLGYAIKLWEDYVSPTGRAPMPHQAYVKHWQLGDPKLPVDFVLVDEAQDLDPLMIDVLLRQHCQRVVVGDENQAIYGWRGARNSMGKFPSAWRAQLTMSFRFGQQVAEEAQKWLTLLGSELQIRGNPAVQSRVSWRLNGDADAVICRTNSGVIFEVMAGLKRGKRVAVAGDRKVQELEKLARAAAELQTKGRTSHPDFQGFESWEALEEFAAGEGDTELATFVNLMNQNPPELVVDALRRLSPVPQANVVVSTAHIAKGLEWGRVRVWHDFPEPQEVDGSLCVRAEEARLAYVAVTRAKCALGTGSLSWVDRVDPSEVALV